MTVKIGTVEFYRAMAEVLNNDPDWVEKGKNLSYDMVFNSGAPAESSVFCRFESGKVTEVRDVTPGDLDSADFVIDGSSEVWTQIVRKEIKPMTAVTKRDLKVRGKMSVLLGNVGAFSYVLDAMTQVDSE
jgi:putative sterol carrier protein